MSFSSKSSNGRHYRNAHNGSSHYQKKGLFGNLFDIFASGSRSNKNYNNYGNQYNNTPMPNETLANQNSMICHKCNSEIPVGSKFCLQCGERVNDALFCLQCGEKLPSNAKFCHKCGYKISN